MAPPRPSLDLAALTLRELALAVEGGQLHLDDVRAELALRGPNLEPRTGSAASPSASPESAADRARALVRQAHALLEQAQALLGAA